MSIFGDLERVLADLYPYRLPLTLAGLAVFSAAVFVAIRRGWHQPVRSWVSANQLSSVIVAVLFLAVTLPTGYYLLSPLWERTTLIEASPLDSATVASLATDSDPVASPTTPSSGDSGAVTPAAGDGPRLVGQGAFSGADQFHFAEGSALIVETAPETFVLRFEDFSIRNGPDLFVYLSSDPDVPSADAIQLGELKATDGAFNYEIPAGTDLSSLRYAMVWCDRFSVLFATAPLGS